MVSSMGKDYLASELAREFSAAAASLNNEVRTALYLGALKAHEKATTSIRRGVKTGHMYEWRAVGRSMKPDSFRMIKGRKVPVKMRDKLHRASRRGEAPASDTGRLAGGITVRQMHYGALLTSSVKYSGILEDKSALNRPFIAPAVRLALPKIEEYINKAIDRALGG